MVEHWDHNPNVESSNLSFIKMLLKIPFLFFSSILLLSATLVITLQNSVHSVICLVLSFIASACILLLLECEFFAFIFLIVYVGAIAVLFLFVVMMLDTKYLVTNKRNPFKYFFFGIFSALNFLFFTLTLINDFFSSNNYINLEIFSQFTRIQFWREDIIIEIEALGQLLYTHFVLHFLIAGLILFLSILGVVALSTTLSEKKLIRDVKPTSRVNKF